MSHKRYPLGRRHAADPLDANYPMATLLPRVPAAVLPTYKYWTGSRTHLDQTGDSCVANGWTHFLSDSPRSHRLTDLDSDNPGWGGSWSPAYVSGQSREVGFRGWLYDQAQIVDEFDDTPPAGGTSVRAGAKVLQSIGAIKSYHWATNGIQDVITALLTTGPVVIGTTWYESMFNVQANGFIDYDPSSGVAGGHCTKVDGVNVTDRKARVKNSWGTGWGVGGYFWIKLPDLAALIDHGEACIALEP